MNEVLRQVLWRYFLGQTCPVCHKAKKAKQCFDANCYFALTEPERNGLYVKAYEDAFYDNYQAAIAKLRGLGYDKL
jgi:hypothetical protein